MNLHEKLIEVGKAIPYLKKENDNQQQGFKYVSSSQVLAAIKPKMQELKVLLIPRVLAQTFHHKGTDKMHITELAMEYTWVNAEDPKETITVLWYCQGTDQHEKGVGKALTYGEKYFILKFFQVPTDKDDPDAFEEKHAPPKPSSGVKWVGDNPADCRSEIMEYYVYLYKTVEKANSVLEQEGKKPLFEWEESTVKRVWMQCRKDDK